MSKKNLSDVEYFKKLAKNKPPEQFIDEIKINDAFIRNTEMVLKNKMNEIVRWINKQQALKRLLLSFEIEHIKETRELSKEGWV